jgi:ribonuclease P protein component
VLARDQRMRSGEDFRHTIRRGRRAAQPTLVTHVVPGTDGPTSVGFVVSKAVGSAVVRNRVKRRLRHLMRERVDALPAGTRVVVRALPPSAPATSADLGTALDVALRRAGGR